MADYPIISDVSQHMVRILREKMCPEPIPSPNNISVSSPAEQDVDYILGLYPEKVDAGEPVKILKIWRKKLKSTMLKINLKALKNS